MLWDIVADDSYFKGRALESKARSENSPAAWLEYSVLKAAKGSYAMAAIGRLNAGIIFEASGDARAAAGAYEQGFIDCTKGGLKELALLLVSRRATLAERAGDFTKAASAYEKLGAFFEEKESFFLAADAYEHASEMIRAGGADIAGYRKPVELWLRNAEYWAEQGHADDEAWSRRRAELYLEFARSNGK